MITQIVRERAFAFQINQRRRALSRVVKTKNVMRVSVLASKLELMCSPKRLLHPRAVEKIRAISLIKGEEKTHMTRIIIS